MGSVVIVPKTGTSVNELAHRGSVGGAAGSIAASVWPEGFGLDECGDRWYSLSTKTFEAAAPQKVSLAH